ncbi:MAG: AEC family transporter [Clostridia bacterium]|nr:AEC family transporter [Clostridia bacterium]
MVNVSLLFISVFTLFCYMIPGFILRKTKIADDGFAKALSVFTLYVAQVAMIIHGFLVEFNFETLKGIGIVFAYGLIAHIVFYLLAMCLFKKAPERLRKVLRFGVIFSNAGYMGIPIISDVFGEEYVIYATIYIVWFNVFAYSIGRLIYTGDKKFISIKKIFINPAVVPITIGLIIFLTGGGTWVSQMLEQAKLASEGLAESSLISEGVSIVYNIITVLKNMVAPASMMVIGAKLADIKFGGIFKDKYLYPFIALRLLIFPAIVWGIMRICIIFGLVTNDTMAIVLILSSTPAAALTTIFAELYNCDAVYAGKLVAITTLLSVGTMPLVAMLLKI